MAKFNTILNSNYLSNKGSYRRDDKDNMCIIGGNENTM